MINCKEFQSFISEYIDGEISESLKSEIKAHLETCAHCSLILKNTLSLKNYLRNLKKVKTSQDFEVVLRQRLQKEITNMEAGKERKFLPVPSLPLKPAIGTFLGVVAIASFVTIYQTYYSKSSSVSNGGTPINNQMIDKRPGSFSPRQATQRNVDNTGKFNVNSRSVTVSSAKSDTQKNELELRDYNNKR